MRSFPLITAPVATASRDEMVDITPLVARHVARCGVNRGMVAIFVPHTTAGITINENADPSVRHDILCKLRALVPRDERFYEHVEGNSDAHLKASMMGFALTVLIEGGELVLGRWQAIYLCEFDGPRQRQVMLRVIAFDE